MQITTMFHRLGKRLLLPLALFVALTGMTATVAATPPVAIPAEGGTALTDGLLPGPLGLNPPPATGQLPMAVQIPAAGVDANIEHIEIIDGVMQDPSGPFIVSWYEETARLGARGNAVLSGHVDYWSVGPAVFYEVEDLVPGDEVQAVGADGDVFRYAVEWVETFDVAQLTSETINELVGPTVGEKLTLVTCGGTFNQETGEYLSRTIIRATRLPDEGTAAVTTEGEQPAVPLQEGGTAVVSEPALNMRAEATTGADVVALLTSGDEVTITGPSVEADGYTWWPVETSDGTTGFVAADFIEGAE